MRVINLALPLALPVQHSNPVIWQIFFCQIFAHFPQLTHLTQYLLTQLVVKNDVLLSIRARALMESNRELQKEATNKTKKPTWVMSSVCGTQACSNYYNALPLSPQRYSGSQEEWWGAGGGGASQQPLLCRMHAGCQTMIIQESKTEGDSSTAKYSVLPPVSLYLPLLLCLAAAAVLLLLPLRRTLSLSVCIFAC